MNVTVFCGPSLLPSEVRSKLPGAKVLGPAACGDVIRAVREGATHIGLIDGYFDHQPSVWHKELLWALAQGKQVYGAASMGALRAAELEAFGMTGIGKIFMDFRDGILQDDDEVAVTHEPAERGYRPVSDALVNMRATLAHALESGVLSSATATILLKAVKGRFYPDRTYRTMLSDAAEAGVSTAVVTQLASWLERGGAIDQKRCDALQLIDRVATDIDAPSEPSSTVDFHFEHTDAFDALCRRLDAERLVPQLEDYQRALALAMAEGRDVALDPASVQRSSEEFRRRHGLLSSEDMATWFTHASIDVRAFSELVYEQTLIETHRREAYAAAARQRQRSAVLASARGIAATHGTPKSERK